MTENNAQKPALRELANAVRRNDIKAIRDFLARGADINVQSNLGSVIDIAQNHGRTKIVQILKEELQKKFIFCASRYINQLALIREFLEQGVEINGKDTDGRTALMHAARTGSLDVAQFLTDKGASLNEKDKNGWTALMFAVDNRHKETVHFLIEAGASPDEKDNAGHTALDLIDEKFYPEIAALLKNAPHRQQELAEEKEAQKRIAEEARHVRVVEKQARLREQASHIRLKLRP